MTIRCDAISNESILHTFPNYGRSGEAQDISERLDNILDDFSLSFTVTEHYEQIEKVLHKAAEEASQDNWDGYGAKRISSASYEKATRFCKMLPISVPIPDVCVDPDGMVELEWYKEPRKVFSVTIESDGTLIFAGLFGFSKIHGMENFGDEIPKTIFDSIQRIYSS
ncbi:MAG: hypothetical protein HY665_09905 [Chloroflexi bacterium]|nr:hypothetical protein [Chloroflexota bacterium]